MTTISLIAAVDAQYGLGKQNRLLCHLPADLQHFKRVTWGKCLIMGWNTFTSIGKPLPGRLNLVLSHHKRIHPGITCIHSFEEAFILAKQYAQSVETNAEEIMVIGGAQVYEQALPLASQIYLTKIDAVFDADVFFPQISSRIWECVENDTYPQDAKNKHSMTFCRYVRKDGEYRL